MHFYCSAPRRVKRNIIPPVLLLRQAIPCRAKPFRRDGPMSGPIGRAKSFRRVRTCQTGSSHSGRYKPFRQTCRVDTAFQAAVRPGQAIRAAVTGRYKPDRPIQARKGRSGHKAVQAGPQSLPSPQPSYAVCNGLVPSTVRV